jgi:hypothetical protein
MGPKRLTYRIPAGKGEVKRPIESSKHTWEYNIKVDLGNRMEWELVSPGSGQKPVAGSLEHGIEPSQFVNSCKFYWMAKQLLAPQERLSSTIEAYEVAATLAQFQTGPEKKQHL